MLILGMELVSGQFRPLQKQKKEQQKITVWDPTPHNHHTTSKLPSHVSAEESENATHQN